MKQGDKVRCIHDECWDQYDGCYSTFMSVKGIRKGGCYTIQQVLDIKHPVGWFGPGIHYKLTTGGIYHKNRFTKTNPELLKYVEIL
jgi:hypothetical protein